MVAFTLVSPKHSRLLAFQSTCTTVLFLAVVSVSPTPRPSDHDTVGTILGHPFSPTLPHAQPTHRHHSRCPHHAANETNFRNSLGAHSPVMAIILIPINPRSTVLYTYTLLTLMSYNPSFSLLQKSICLLCPISRTLPVVSQFASVSLHLQPS